MKTPGPNPLPQALAHSQQAGLHPDPDLLTGFAEGTLLTRERKDLLEHLAVCPQCREILSLSTAAAPEPSGEVERHAPPGLTHTALRSWLPWVSAAAGIVVVFSAVLLHRQNKPQFTTSPQVASIRKKEIDQAPPRTIQPTKISPESQAKRARPAAAPPKKPVRTPPRSAENATVASSVAAGVAGVEGGVAGSTDQMHGDHPGSSHIPTAKAVEGELQSIEAQGAISSRSSAAFAGPARAPNERAALSAYSVRPHWRIDENGQVERSFGNGPWQPVLTNEKSKMHVVSVFDRDAWIGGENLSLYHSSDDGTTWTPVTLPNKDGREHAITHIRFHTPQAGTVEAEDGTSWTSIDGGRTWQYSDQSR